MGTPERIVAQIICGVMVVLLLTDTWQFARAVHETSSSLFSFLFSLFSFLFFVFLSPFSLLSFPFSLLPLPLLFPERTCTSIKAFQDALPTLPYLGG